MVLGLLVVGCGSAVAQPHMSPSPSTVSSPGASPSTMPSPVASQPPSPTPSTATLYAVLESSGQYLPNSTVAIAGLDGYARAKAHFTPRSTPYIPDAAVVLAPEAHVVAGVVYFVDGHGVVRTLDRTGRVRLVATFPLTQKQQEISFAVSPDGKRLASCGGDHQVRHIPAFVIEVLGAGCGS